MAGRLFVGHLDEPFAFADSVGLPSAQPWPLLGGKGLGAQAARRTCSRRGGKTFAIASLQAMAVPCAAALKWSRCPLPFAERQRHSALSLVSASSRLPSYQCNHPRPMP